MSPPTRRTVLRGLLGGALVHVGLPPLALSHAQTPRLEIPRRFGLCTWGNGGLPAALFPAHTGADPLLWQQPLLRPLAPFAAQLSVYRDLRWPLPARIAHFSGLATLVSAAPLTVRGPDDFSLSAPSLDQLALHPTQRPLLLSAEPSPWATSVDLQGQPRLPSQDARALFTQIFGGPAHAAPTQRGARSVLDPLGAARRDLERQLPREDRPRWQRYLWQVRDLERQLWRAHDPQAPPAQGPWLARLVALALASGRAHSFSYQLSAPASAQRLPAAPEGLHALSHTPGGQARVLALVLPRLAELLHALAQIEEVEGSLLDHCALLCGSEQACARTHRLDGQPLLVAGGAGGRLPTGQILSRPQGTVPQLGLGLLHATGRPLPSLGHEAARCTAPLPGLDHWAHTAG